ncbi:hypothetical protein M231_00874 [Tremella mesenterica]|uniref:Uncharacterized protein n=1 Tax=Tremella mesenterica TaxID=5217 RepID=A0A4Q1BUV1_TREME|nr:uncharacterized protein TREMEDRAFT_65773 [Tremella mesenterica DSM 1558]EIW66171.1 hypothetical protein TREMEDRAFT_65773 [Tremella mesenterica DSM 1558]RXK41875.1 hypothetical protein M231_00874 [Tremella mesenterica]
MSTFYTEEAQGDPTIPTNNNANTVRIPSPTSQDPHSEEEQREQGRRSSSEPSLTETLVNPPSHTPNSRRYGLTMTVGRLHISVGLEITPDSEGNTSRLRYTFIREIRFGPCGFRISGLDSHGTNGESNGHQMSSMMGQGQSGVQPGEGEVMEDDQGVRRNDATTRRGRERASRERSTLNVAGPTPTFWAMAGTAVMII